MFWISAKQIQNLLLVDNATLVRNSWKRDYFHSITNSSLKGEISAICHYIGHSDYSGVTRIDSWTLLFYTTGGSPGTMHGWLHACHSGPLFPSNFTVFYHYFNCIKTRIIQNMRKDCKKHPAQFDTNFAQVPHWTPWNVHLTPCGYMSENFKGIPIKGFLW